MRTTMTVNEGVAHITIDDGKVNAMSAEMLDEICDRLEAAATAAEVTVLRGRPGIFSAGFDMPTFSRGLEPTHRMMSSGMQAITRMLRHPHPIVAACTGHAYPMGAFLLMSADLRFGVRGDYRIGMNEVAIGLTVPRFALALAEHRLTRPGLMKITTGEMVDPEEAGRLGYLDYTVDTEQLDPAVDAAVSRLRSIDQGSHASTKTRIHASLVDTINSCRQPDALNEEILALAGRQ